MTDRHSGYIVTLEKDTRNDDDEDIINALRMVRGVISVQPVVASPEGHIADMRARRDMQEKLWKLYKEVSNPTGETE